MLILKHPLGWERGLTYLQLLITWAKTIKYSTSSGTTIRPQNDLNNALQRQC